LHTVACRSPRADERDRPIAPSRFPGRGVRRRAHDLSQSHDWSRRWYSEHERYGAGILVTRAEDLPEGTDPFAGLAGEHVIGSRVGIEIKTFVRQGCPVAWQAVVFPANYWLSRFAIQPFNCISTSHYAGLSAAHTVEPFHPVIGPDFFRVVRG
jgi:hypothetical protein